MQRRSFPLPLTGILVAFTLASCGAPKDKTEDEKKDDEKKEETSGPALLGGADCDPLVPTQCGFPFPSDVYTVADESSPTGRRVRFGKKTLPRANGAIHMDAAQWDDSDGFSATQAPLTHLPGATVTGLPTQDDIGASLEDDSPTVLLNAVTGERVPHFAELDRTSDDDGDRALLIRPVVRLKDATRYIVAVRNVVDADGEALPPSPVFAALRDGTDHDHPSVELRRALYEDIFETLEDAGIDRDSLQIAWDYTTASRENNTGDMVHMRDEALATVGEDGPEYRVVKITEFQEGPRNEGATPPTHPYVWKRLELEMKAPLYLTQKGPGARLVRDEDGTPVQNGWDWFPVLVQIPHSAKTDAPLAVLQQGHGLLGRRTEGQNGYFARLANEKKYVALAVDLIGMASDDEDYILTLITGDMGRFRESVDRQHQGMLNSLLAMRMMKRLAQDEQTFWNDAPTIDDSRRYYRGDSQGGIMGATYMALSTDVERGYFGEPGMPYNFLLNRSVDFEDFFLVLRSTYSTARDLQIVLGLVQMHWDRIEPSGYASYITKNPLPNTPAKQVLLHAALGDLQVTPLGAHIMAREVGAKMVGPVVRPVWGLEIVDEAGQPFTGSGYQEFDFGLPEVPKTNVPPPEDLIPKSKDPHDEVREMAEVFEATDRFLRTGEIANTCAGKPIVEDAWNRAEGYPRCSPKP